MKEGLLKCASLYALVLSFMSSAFAAQSPLINCHDGMSFGAGQIQVTTGDDLVVAYLRGREEHGRRVGDLARDMKFEFPYDGHLVWAAVSFPKDKCLIDEKQKLVMGCAVPENRGQIIFYEGQRLDNLKELARQHAEVNFLLDQNLVSSFSPLGFLTSHDNHVQQVDMTRGRFIVSSQNSVHGVYRSTIEVAMLSEFCDRK